MNIKAINFDFYGTLVDYFSVWAQVTQGIIDENGLNISAADFTTEWKRVQRRVLEENEFRDYKELVTESLNLACDKNKIKNRDYHKILFEKWNEIEPFPEVPNTLKKLKEKYKLAICSNSSRDLYEVCADKLPFKFQRVIVSDEVKANKPNSKIYQIAIKNLGVNPEKILHVASSLMDVKGATNANMVVCWINRRSEKVPKGSVRPKFEINRLDEIFKIL